MVKPVSKPTISVVMPVYNEEHSIRGFIEELIQEFSGLSPLIHVVDDASTDGTPGVLQEVCEERPELTWERNPKNAGHGKSTLTGLKWALDSESQFVVTTDGDGNIRARDLRRLAENAISSGAVVEGVRRERISPWFRRITSFLTRALVFVRSGSFPKDANTPHRVYPRDALEAVFDLVGPESLTPNLEISALFRMRDERYLEIDVREFERSQNAQHGVTWKQKFRSIPSANFLRFVSKAVWQWVIDRNEKPSSRGKSVDKVFGLGRGSILRYGLIGGTGVALDYLSFLLLLSLGAAPLAASIFGTVAGISNNYLWNSLINFKRELDVRVGFRFVSVGIVGLVLASLLFHALFSLGVEPELAKAISIPPVVVLQFIANRSWTFSRP